MKTFGERRVVDGVGPTVPAGTVYGVLGPHGAGRTTFVQALVTLPRRPDGGQARIFDRDVVRGGGRGARPRLAHRAVRLGGRGRGRGGDGDLTGTEDLVFLGRLLGHGKSAARTRVAEHLLEAFGLTEVAARQVKSYSGCGVV
ncbi:ATP-binding cassette domain-containing protein [Streptomyces sp. NPDC012510]|uniref:ATP-binding cassette domain-containing protein n=1 Tax=Streptomyces sp. NPDC012510 TaxID=3364838 RepID=UPI0036E6EFB1